jgi:hypothetical protein
MLIKKFFLVASINESSYFSEYEPSFIIEVCWSVFMCSTLSVLACVIVAMVSCLLTSCLLFANVMNFLDLLLSIDIDIKSGFVLA